MRIASLLCSSMVSWCALTSLALADTIQVPLVFHVAEIEGKPVADEAFLQDQLEHANVIYRPLGFELAVVGRRKLAASHARLVDRGDRDALQASLRTGVINAFIVAQLMDVDEPGRERKGVHWRVRKKPSDHFVVVSIISFPYVLAHELGHFFGNQQHSDVPGNLMCYERTEAVPFLDESQQERVIQTIRAMFASRELRTVTKSPNVATERRR